MALSQSAWSRALLVFALVLVALPWRAAAFGAGNIPSIAQVEGHNWRHGDIEDMLKTLFFLHGKKWTSMLVGRTYFGNWLRDYSQAVDVGSLKGVNAATIRILVWVLSFMANGYATEEFEVTEERLGVYRPEEHIDNPLGYADGMDARKFDPRLRGPIDPREVEVDSNTGMKNYIANERGGWATSAGYLRFSFARSIHFGRVYTNGASGRGKEENLCEALRCLGQALHTMEDFSAHSNYCELALRDLGFHDVFPHCGTATEINLRGKRVYPLVTGTFGAVDFLHSVLGEATDHFTQSEVDEMNVALKNAESNSGKTSVDRSFFGSDGGGDFISTIAKLPGIGDAFAKQAQDLRAASAAQARAQANQQTRSADNVNIVPGMSPGFDPVKVAKQIYPILEFRDRIVKSISNMISKIPGLEKLIEHISETLTAFVLGLLAPFIRPIIDQVSKVLKDGSSGVISSSANAQLEPWQNPRCDNPTHSMLSKDHFTNILNSCAGRVACTVLQYVVPRVLYAWENPGVPVDEIVSDVLRVFHHPAARDEHIQIQRDMFETVRRWSDETPHRHQLNRILGSESVKHGKNHILSGGGSNARSVGGGGHSHADHGHGKPAGSLWTQVQARDLQAMGPGASSSYTSPDPAARPAAFYYEYGRQQQQQPPPMAPGYAGQGYGGPPPPVQTSYHQAYPGQYVPPPQQPSGGDPGYAQPSHALQHPGWGQQYPPY